MRLIDADALKEYYGKWANKNTEFLKAEVDAYIDAQPTIGAEPVRHGEDTSYITTDDMDKYHSRIILNEGEKNHGCRVFYEDDREHGRWIVSKVDAVNTEFVCSECSRKVVAGNDYYGKPTEYIERIYPYCHCGAKMDAKEDDNDL